MTQQLPTGRRGSVPIATPKQSNYITPLLYGHPAPPSHLPSSPPVPQPQRRPSLPSSPIPRQVPLSPSQRPPPLSPPSNTTAISPNAFAPPQRRSSLPQAIPPSLPRKSSCGSLLPDYPPPSPPPSSPPTTFKTNNKIAMSPPYSPKKNPPPRPVVPPPSRNHAGSPTPAPAYPPPISPSTVVYNPPLPPRPNTPPQRRSTLTSPRLPAPSPHSPPPRRATFTSPSSSGLVTPSSPPLPPVPPLSALPPPAEGRESMAPSSPTLPASLPPPSLPPPISPNFSSSSTPSPPSPHSIPSSPSSSPSSPPSSPLSRPLSPSFSSGEVRWHRSQATPQSYPPIPPLPLKDDGPLRSLRKEHIKVQEDLIKSQDVQLSKTNKAHQDESSAKEKQAKKDLDQLIKETELHISQLEALHAAEIKKMEKEYDDREKHAHQEIKAQFKIATKDRLAKTKERVKAEKERHKGNKVAYEVRKNQLEGETKIRLGAEEEIALLNASRDVMNRKIMEEEALLMKRIFETHQAELKKKLLIFTHQRKTQKNGHDITVMTLKKLHQLQEESIKTNHAIQTQQLDKEANLLEQLLSSQQLNEKATLERDLEKSYKTELKEFQLSNKKLQKVHEEEIKKYKKDKKNEWDSRNMIFEEKIIILFGEFEGSQKEIKEQLREDMRSRHNEEILSTTELMDALKKKMKRDQNTAKTELENKIKEQLSGIERVHHTEFSALMIDQEKELREIWRRHFEKREIEQGKFIVKRAQIITQMCHKKTALYTQLYSTLLDMGYIKNVGQDQKMSEEMGAEAQEIIGATSKKNQKDREDNFNLTKQEEAKLETLIEEDVGDVNYFQSLTAMM